MFIVLATPSASWWGLNGLWRWFFWPHSNWTPSTAFGACEHPEVKWYPHSISGHWGKLYPVRVGGLVKCPHDGPRCEREWQGSGRRNVPSYHASVLFLCFCLFVQSQPDIYIPTDGQIATQEKRRHTWRASASVRYTCFFIPIAHNSLHFLISPFQVKFYIWF